MDGYVQKNKLKEFKMKDFCKVKTLSENKCREIQTVKCKKDFTEQIKQWKKLNVTKV